MNRLFLVCLIFAFVLGAGGTVFAAEKITFEDHVLPILRNSCLKCHNPDKLKGDLDLTTLSNLVKGGGSGPGVVSGDPEGSRLFRAITHAEEPNMPPNTSKLPDKEIDVIKSWISGGLLENSGSRGFAANKPKVDLSVAVSSLVRPEGPPPMPQDLFLEPVTHTARTSVSTALANSPWAPLIALGGQKQVLLYDSDTLELAGILPFPEGFPHDLKFSRNGKLLLVGGGQGSRSGLAAVWDVRNGERVITVGAEFDTALAADISADQNWIALGGPSRLVKIYSTKDGEMHHKMKKHTDWVTALEFSPDSKFLATGDRNGGLVVWEAATGQEQGTLTGHKGSITGLSWRGDSDLLISSSEDGTVKIWKVSEGQQVKSWPAHNGGVLSVKSARDGRIVSCGRDSQILIWDADGTKQRSIALTNELPVRVSFSHDGGRVVGSDWAGNVFVWNSVGGKNVGQLSVNPPSLAEQSEAAARRLTELKRLIGESAATLAAVELAVAQTETELGAVPKNAPNYKPLAKQAEAARQKAKDAKMVADQARSDWARAENALPRFKVAQFYTTVHRARTDLAARQTDHARLMAEAAAAKAASEKASTELAEVRRTGAKTRPEKAEQAQRIKTLNEVVKISATKIAATQTAIEKATKELALEQTRVEKLNAEYLRLKSDAPAAPKAAQL